MTPAVRSVDFLYLLPYAVSAVLSAGMAAASAGKKSAPSVRFFGWVLWLEVVWTSLLILRYLSPSIQGKLFWNNVHFPITQATCAAFFLFARVLTGKPPKPKPGLFTALWVPFVLAGLLAFTDPLHGLVRSRPHMNLSVPFGELVFGFTSLDYLLFAYEYGLALAAIGMLLRAREVGSARERKKMTLVILGFSIPFMGLLLTVFNIRIFGRRDLSPIWFLLGNLPIALALFRYHLFNIVPLARRTLVESLGDPVIVVDSDMLLLDCNKAFASLAGSHERRLRGRSVPELLSARDLLWAEDPRELPAEKTAFGSQRLVTIPGPGGERHFRVHVSAVPCGRTREADVCWAAVFRDVTALVSAERRLASWNAELEGRVRQRTQDLELEAERRKKAEDELRLANSRIIRSQHELLWTLSELVENRSPETAQHVWRVGEYARILAQAYGAAPENIDLIAEAAPLHDVGKIAIPDHILNKNGRLTEDERDVMRTHTVVGYRILGSSRRSMLRMAAVMALEHHERWNGEGYPAGKSGSSISLSGRIVAICDVFDALATPRPYKEAWDIQRIIDYIRGESGAMFDPDLVGLFLEKQEQFREVAR